MSRARFKEVEDVMRQCEDQGCKTVLTKAGHWKVFVPNGPLITCPATSSDYRGIKNVKAQLRRAGLDV